MDFVPLNLPKANLKLSKSNNIMYVWCIIRKKKLVLTPEEWVRQHIIHYLIQQKKIPVSLIASEVSIEINNLKRRCDILIFNMDLSYKMLIECKAPEIKLDSKVIQQIIHYNSLLKVPIIAISNGIQHEIIEIDYKLNKFKKMIGF
jgi:hypothetical protein